MILQPIEIKKDFQIKFRQILEEEPVLKEFIFEVFVYGTAYVVGGFFRDFLDNKESRDIDIIIDLDNVKLLDIIKNLNCNYTQNRHGGIKLQLKNMSVDLWSLENNWAFKHQLVKLNENDKLNSIAKGCFFNYDSLVINLHNYTYNIKYYNDFKKKKMLDILQMTPKYKNLNPTLEANVIRTFYLKQKYDITFSNALIEYIVKKVSLAGIERLLETKMKYPKYQDLSDEMLIKELRHLQKDNNELFFNV